MYVYIDIYISIYIYSPHGFTLSDSKSVMCLLQNEIVTCCLIVADGCKIISVSLNCKTVRL